jgi:tetratricopeptide (TPR) repeat protein
MKSTIKILLLIISGLSVYFHYHNNVSSEIQKLLYDDLKNGIFKEASTARFHVLNLEFPNLSLSSIPMKGLVARYYFLGAQYDKALELLAESDNVNPYIMYNESLKQDIYFKLGEKDSVLYYAEKSFTGIPNNHKHFIDLARAYRNFDRYHLIDSIFKKVEKSKISDIWKFYFAAILTQPDSISNYGKQKAVEAINLFGDSDFNLKISALYVLYGFEQIDKSLDVEIEAADLYIAEKYRDAAIKYEEAINLNPIEYTHYENAGISNYKFGYFDRAITQLKYVIDSLNPKTGKSEFIIANVYNELEDYENACKYIYLSSKFDYKDSFRLIGEYCK